MRLHPRTSIHHQRQTIITVGLLILLALLSFMAGIVANQIYQERTAHFKILLEAHDQLKSHADNSLPQEKQLEYGMIRGMLAITNDPYAAFLEPHQQELRTNQLEGTFGGIGVRLDIHQGESIFLYPLPDSPASRVGLHDGDRLIAVDRLMIDGYTNVDLIQAAIRGNIGTHVELQVQRNGTANVLRFKVKRAEYAAPSVVSNLSTLQQNVGIIKINILSETTPNEVELAIRDLQSQGAEAIILDVRNNSEGLIESGLETARLFLREGAMIQEDSRGKGIQTYTANRPGVFLGVPLAILVNRNTAGAAEILAVVLQSQQRAVVVGSQTPGKDSIQRSFTLGDQSSILITTGRWWPVGWDPTTHWSGVLPNIPLVDEEANGNAAQQSAIQALFP